MAASRGGYTGGGGGGGGGATAGGEVPDAGDRVRELEQAKRAAFERKDWAACKAIQRDIEAAKRGEAPAPPPPSAAAPPPAKSGGAAAAPPRARPQRQYSQVIVLGDSWAKYMWPCWPERLATLLGAPSHNVAVPGSTTFDLPGQARAVRAAPGILRTAAGALRADTLCVVHTGGNDFIRTFGADVLRPNPGEREAAKVGELLEALHGLGCRDFVVSDVPMSPAIPMIRIGYPMIGAAIAQGAYREMGIEPGETPDFVLAVQQTALHDAWDGAIAAFRGRHGDARVAHFNEATALSRLAEQPHTAAQMWDFTQFHPSELGHRRIADEALVCLRLHWDEAAPAGAAPPAAPSAERAGGASGAEGGGDTEALRRLAALGFADAAARDALRQAGGDEEVATALLLSAQ